MKSILISLFLIPFLSYSSIQVKWDMPQFADEVFKSDGSTPLSTNSVWQLIWSPDQTISSFNPFNPFEVDSSEAILKEFNNTNGSFVLNEIVTDPGSTFEGGYVYTRAFDYTGATSGFNLNDLDGMRFVESGFSGPLQKIDSIPAGSPTEHIPFSGPTVVDQTFTVIPEPTTLMALLVGIVGLVGFRGHLLKK